ncbi:type IVB secretion system protein IcmG/DotF [Legionella feeleii]|uniref:Protein IcmG (DotF) n=1 Tax=Legionella feeleii TaxID=453 RepID=A0A378J047_9GAMM|nr:type IVB secretion system protein IcmG/DotF [Legionella feeleii]STX37654.1 protein IcmG (DotF) [Legionella feeleii]
MADDKDEYSDEYQFADLDVISPDSSDGDAGSSEAAGAEKKQFNSGGRKDIRRNALIVVGIVIVIMLTYEFWGMLFSGKTTDAETTTVPPITTATPQPTPTQPVVTAPVQPVTPPTPPVQAGPDNTQITQKLSALELSQQNLRSEVNALNDQLSGINSNVNELASKIADLNQMLTTLAAKVDQQSNQIDILTTRTAPKPVPRIVHKGPPRPVFYIQAVIPGRAWLIATNGSTLTVREGSQIAGYGVVKLIDARQGRVITSSGQVIRFSQQDS